MIPHDYQFTLPAQLENLAFQLFAKWCDVYPSASNEWRTKIRRVLMELIDCFDTNSTAHVFDAMVKMFHDAVVEARTLEAECEDIRRAEEQQWARQQTDKAVTK